MKTFNIKQLILSTLLVLLVFASLDASSHREAPLISNDPLADNVDVYAFRSPDNPDMVTLIATYIPFQLPQGGPNYYNFGQNVRYEIHVDNDASVVGDEITYRFTFTIENEDPTTFFNIRLGKQNQKATYTLERSMDGGATFETIVQDGIVPPNNIGDRSITGGAGLNGDYSSIWTNSITTASTGERVFAGPSDDPFFVDLGGIFDLGDSPRQNGEAVDGVACFNVSTLAIQVPISTLLKQGAPDQPENILDPNYVIGVWASASRPAITTLSNDNNPTYDGDWVQVSRLGMPLTNEAVIPIGFKDYWNSITPYEELAETQMDEFFYNPELALYMDDDQFGAAVPALAALRIQTSSLGSFDFTNGADGVSALKGGDLTGTAFETFGDLLLIEGKPRSVDLWPIFHTGVPNAIPYQLATGKEGNPLAAGKPFINNFLPNGGDMLRLNMAVPPTPRDDPNFSSLGLIQAAAIGLTVAPFNTTADLEFIPNMDGFPNGRRLEDDVTRIELQAVGGAVLAAIGLWYDDYDPASSPSPVTEDLLNVLTFTTGVESNDKAFRSTFPYVAEPFSGTGGCSGKVYDGEPEEEPAEVSLFVSSNNQSSIGVLGVDKTLDVSLFSFASLASDADGIYYDAGNDVLFQLNRSDNTINAYGDVKDAIAAGNAPMVTATSTSDFTNGREIAVRANKLVVAQDAADNNGMTNKFVVYNASENSITYDTEYTSPINLWGIQFVGSSLYAIEDNSSNLVIFENFLTNTGGQVEASKTIAIENMVRTHGVTIDIENNLMILTDVGLATDATDGAIVLVNDYEAAIADDVISSDEQIRLAGPKTQLGNPVDVAYDDQNMRIYVAERANDGGKIVGFDMPLTEDDRVPDYQRAYAGASAIFYTDYEDDSVDLTTIKRFFSSSNNSGFVSIFNVKEDNSIERRQVSSSSIDNDGIHYEFTTELLYQLDRENNVVNVFSNVINAAEGLNQILTLESSSTSDFTNGREIAVIDDRLVVAQDASDANNNVNKFVIYRISGTTLTYEKEYITDFNLWGLHVEEEALYAIMDNTNMVAVISNFFSKPDGTTVSPDFTIAIEGLVRTHGITYDKGNDIMVLTDVGEATSDTDGAIITIPNFTGASADELISNNEQLKIAGAMTNLGNPVDVAIDNSNGNIYVAERANGGGRILGFDVTQSGDIMPSFDLIDAGASAIFFDNRTSGVVNVQNVDLEETSIKVYPNPTADRLMIEISEEFDAGESLLYYITDISGRILSHQTISSKTSRIDVSNLISGTYILTVNNGKSAKSLRFTKI